MISWQMCAKEKKIVLTIFIMSSFFWIAGMTSLMSSPFSAMNPFCAAQSYAPLTAKWSTAPKIQEKPNDPYDPIRIPEETKIQEKSTHNDPKIQQGTSLN